MSFTYFPNFPNAPNYPGDDQPLMKTNATSISSLINVDHVNFNNAAGGQHKQITFNANNVPAAPIGNVSVEYTNLGTADITKPQLFWINSSATFPLSAIKAFGVFTASGVNPAFDNQYNLVGTAVGAASPYAITLNAGVTTGNNVIVLVSTATGQAVSYTFVGGVLTITAGVGLKVSFAILQI